METVLILGALEVLPAEVEDLAVVPPQKAGNDDGVEPDEHDLDPVRLAQDVHGREEEQPDRVAVAEGLGVVDGDQDGAAEDGHDDEHVATHLCETEENGGVHADEAHDVLFIRLPQGADPGEHTLTQGGRRV